MVQSNLIVCACALHNTTKFYVNVVNAIATILETSTSTNIITNETTLTQYSIKQGLKVFGQIG